MRKWNNDCYDQSTSVIVRVWRECATMTVMMKVKCEYVHVMGVDSDDCAVNSRCSKCNCRVGGMDNEKLLSLITLLSTLWSSPSHHHGGRRRPYATSGWNEWTNERRRKREEKRREEKDRTIDRSMKIEWTKRSIRWPFSLIEFSSVYYHDVHYLNEGDVDHPTLLHVIVVTVSTVSFIIMIINPQIDIIDVTIDQAEP